MDEYTLLNVISFILIVIALYKFFQLLSQAKKLKVGNKLSRKLVHELSQKIKIAITLFSIGCILSLIAIMLSYFQS
ncbi:hypothetical protein [Evansella cellulosilytica]|uniref:Uncharacterized protein n=1 Tax=Evansella cellulosilytica (strain ATCC 21833 / DSM 2522 / FERM P-1141 / JCM 9156 / N-4) TaxID=649639 RepID=E6U1G1_EVAC2|nr:hypothetical protein [Evansella cellulosilytica]ADU29208.1 hypothetical protein Bcell_0932 [Evansella cellulosilytica DSM 2522]